MAEDAGLSLTIDSAGTGAWHAGNPPDPRMREAAAERGYELDLIRARPLDQGDGYLFDHIYAMDASNLADIEEQRLPDWTARVERYLAEDVPDPYHGGPGGFDHVLDLLERRSQDLIEELRHGT
jgi:protein-tyrosine phosphatase